MATLSVYPKKIDIVEVGMRDGLQNIPHWVPTTKKLQWIEALIRCGFRRIEVTSFVNPRIIPQLADAEMLFKALNPDSQVAFSALVANPKGLARAVDCGVKHLAFFTSASETFCQANIHCSIRQSLNNFSEMINTLGGMKDMHLRAYISCAWDCPFDGKMAMEPVLELAVALAELGVQEIVLADTTGKASPDRVENLLIQCANKIPHIHFAVHFHNTYGLALANCIVAMQCGVTTIDSSIAGLGGCPSAVAANHIPGGNVSSEELLFLCQQMGVETEINTNDLTELGIEVARELNQGPFASR